MSIARVIATAYKLCYLLRPRRVVVASLTLVFVLAAVAVPAVGASPPSPTATATFTDNGDCTATVTYTWSGFKGRDLIALYGVQFSGGFYNIARFDLVRDAPGSGTSTFTFSLSGYGTQTWHGFGQLLNSKGAIVNGSDAVSATSSTLTC